MDAAWSPSRGEALHTSTFLGNPVGCAMALAQIAEIKKLKLPQRAAELGEFLLAELQAKIPKDKFHIAVRGLGLMAGVELRRNDGSPATAETFAAVKELLLRGFIFLPEGEFGNVISLTPPLTITKPQLAKAIGALAEVLT
jgi:4-aminobutyrate aminotransferase-like enzyme